MKFMITIIIQNSNNEKLIHELNQIINMEELEIENILDIINKEENFYRLLNTLKPLSSRNKTIKKLYDRLERNPLEFQIKSKSVLEDLQKGMLLSLFSDAELQNKLQLEKPHAIILDNYGVHHAIHFTELCKQLNIILIYLPSYSPKYNPIEQVWRTIKAKISRKYITSMNQLKNAFKTEFEKVVDNKSYWENWLKEFIKDSQI